MSKPRWNSKKGIPELPPHIQGLFISAMATDEENVAAAKMFVSGLKEKIARTSHEEVLAGLTKMRADIARTDAIIRYAIDELRGDKEVI